MKWFFAALLFTLTHVAYTSPDLLIGTTPNAPPFATTSDGKHFLGFEIDIMNEICHRIKANCRYEPVVASNIVTTLATTNMNLAIAAIIVPAAPVEGFIFSLPYLQSNARFMTNKSSSINNPLDIKNKTIGTRKGTLSSGDLFKNLAMSIYSNQVKVIEYQSMPDLLDALKNNEIDVILANAAFVDYWVLNNSNAFKIIGTNIPVGNGYGIMAKSNETALVSQINQTLLSMEADGTYLTIYSRYLS